MALKGGVIGAAALPPLIREFEGPGAGFRTDAGCILHWLHQDPCGSYSAVFNLFDLKIAIDMFGVTCCQ